MKHEFFDHHREGNSPVHRMDPRLKLSMMILFILTVVLVPAHKLSLFPFYALIPLIFALASRISIFHYLGKILKIYPLILMISIFVPFFSGGTELFLQIGFIKIYENGLAKFLLINIKSFLAISMSVILTTTTDMMSLLKGMEKLKIPQMTISIASFMYRYIFLLIDEMERMMMAFKSRYLRLTFLQRTKVIAQMIGIIFIRTYERGERIYLAMESRGFRDKIHTLNELNWRSRDSLILMLFLMVISLPILIFG